MNYKDFKGEDLAKDLFFIKWVKGHAESQWFWETFIEKYPSKVKDIEEGRRIVELLLSANKTDALDNQVVNTLRDDLTMLLKANEEREKDEHLDEFENSKLKKGNQRTWLAVAASIAIILSITALFWQDSNSNLHKVQNIGMDKTSNESETNDSVVVRINPRGQKSVMLLPDGSKVWLNADSKLTYSNDFMSGDQREVFLEGEAFFDVVKNPKLPFIVHTSDINIRVLGTSFNVKSYSDDSRIETTLVEGKVEIDKVSGSPLRKQKTILMPNEKASFSKESKKLDIETIQAQDFVSWRQDRLVFRSESLEEVIKQLERWYNVQIKVSEGAHVSCTLTANIKKETLEEVLDFLAVTHKITYTISGQEIFIEDFECK